MGDGEIKFLLNEKNHTKSCEKIGSKPKKLAERCLITAVKDFCCETCTIKSAEKLSAAPTKATSAKPSALPTPFSSEKPSVVPSKSPTSSPIKSTSAKQSSEKPSVLSSNSPSAKSSALPFNFPSAKPSAMPSNFPSFKPSAVSEPSASLNNTKPNSTPGKPKQNSIGEDPDPSATIPNDIPLLMVAGVLLLILVGSSYMYSNRHVMC